MDNLLQQFLPPYILLGDFNGHNILWGGQNNDSRGELIENFITKNDICINSDRSQASPKHYFRDVFGAQISSEEHVFDIVTM